MARLSSLSISGYKSIRELKEFPLNSLNVLVGANGAGKSNFIGLFKLLNEMYEQRLQAYVQKQGGPDALLHFGRKVTKEIAIKYCSGENFYAFKLLPTLDNKLTILGEQSFTKQPDDDQMLFTVGMHGESNNRSPIHKHHIDNYSKKWRIYHFHDTSESALIKQVNAVNDNLQLKSDGANLAAYLRMLYSKHNTAYQRIVDTIRLAIPYFGDFVQRDALFDTVELEWFHQADSDTPFKAHTLSDGSLRFICLTTLLLQPIELLPDTIIIDEPELGLHPYAITLLADMFKQVAEQGRQLIVATQSVELLNELRPQDIVVVEQDGNGSTFKRFTQKELSDWLEDYTMGELWKRNVLGGRP
ncbi:MAG: AAA family ATPase [Formosimonas sp.]